MRKISTRMRLRWLMRTALAWMLFESGPLWSQDMYNSPYSIYGPGLLHERTSSLNRGVAGTGIGIGDGQHLNHANPASYAAIQFPVTHIFEIGGWIESNQYQTNNAYESRWKGGFSGMSYWFRIKPWIGSSVSITPYSTVAYNVVTQRQLAVGQGATYTYQGSGNITRLSWGNGLKLTKNLYAGISLSYLFGSTDRDETVMSAHSNDILTLEHKTFSNKFSADAGLQYKAKISNTRSLTVGLTYNGGMTFTGKNSYKLTNIENDTLAEYNGKKVQYKLPEKFGAGISLGSKRSVLATDFSLAKWSHAGFTGDDISFRDSRKVSIGYMRFGNEFAESYLGIIGFRLGVYYQEHYLIVKKQPLTNWGATASLSLPVADGRSRVNISYTYDRMGTRERNLILHTAEKIQIDFVIQDIWGKRRRFE